MKKIILNGMEYSVSENGDIFNKRGYKMKPAVDKNGYCSISVNRKRFLIHRVVASAFLGTELYGRKINIHHKDGDKSNNAVYNLEPIAQALHQSLHKTKYPKTKKCIVCGKEFTPMPTKRKRAKTCSRECWLERTREQTKRRAIPVKMDGVKIYTSLTEACIANGLNVNCAGNITKCCQGIIKTAYGHAWEYV